MGLRKLFAVLALLVVFSMDLPAKKTDGRRVESIDVIKRDNVITIQNEDSLLTIKGDLGNIHNIPVSELTIIGDFGHIADDVQDF